MPVFKKVQNRSDRERNAWERHQEHLRKFVMPACNFLSVADALVFKDPPGRAGGPASDGIHVPVIEVRSLAAAVGAGSPGEALSLFGSVGVPAGFPGDHRCREMLGAVGIMPGLVG